MRRVIIAVLCFVMCFGLLNACSNMRDKDMRNKDMYYDGPNEENTGSYYAKTYEKEREEQTEKSENDTEMNDTEISPDNIDENDIKYKIFSNDLIKEFTKDHPLAKTGDEKIDGFLERFYEKILNGDNYIQFFLDNAEEYGVDTSVIDKLIDMNSNIRMRIWLEDLKDYLNEKENYTTETEQ